MTDAPAAGPAVRPARLPRAGRHLAGATLLVLLACLLVFLLSWLSHSDSSGHLDRLRASTIGTVSEVNPGSARVSWLGGVATVPMAATVRVGLTTEVRYDPDHPADAVIPGAALLAALDRSAGGLVFPPLVALAVLACSGYRLAASARSARGPARVRRARRVRYQRGLFCRSWLEIGTGAWLPVHWDPALVELPAPAPVTLRGGRRPVVDLPDGTRLYPAGRVTRTEPRGRRTDSPAHPDPAAVTAAHRIGPLRTLRVDAALLVPVPLLALGWTWLAGTGASGWLAATAIAAPVALWLPAWHGADPT